MPTSPGPGTVPFLILNRDVVERGERLLGSVHAAYFFKGLSLIGEWQYGYGSYATPPGRRRRRCRSRASTSRGAIS